MSRCRPCGSYHHQCCISYQVVARHWCLHEEGHQSFTFKAMCAIRCPAHAGNVNSGMCSCTRKRDLAMFHMQEPRFNARAHSLTVSSVLARVAHLLLRPAVEKQAARDVPGGRPQQADGPPDLIRCCALRSMSARIVCVTALAAPYVYIMRTTCIVIACVPRNVYTSLTSLGVKITWRVNYDAKPPR